MNEIVEALGQREELRFVAANHQPLHGDTKLPEDRDHSRQHLGDAAPASGRVHHPHGAPLETRDQGPGFRTEIADGL